MPLGIYERKKKPVEERFWSKVNKDTESGCWEWKASTTIGGYGSFSDQNRKSISAHRYSYEFHYGGIPEGMHVMHKCDNPKCVKPDHLSVGTHLDNMRDKKNKNRQVKGSLAGMSKLTEEQVKNIKIKLLSGVKQSDIAKEFQTHKTNISYISREITWTHVKIN